MKKTLAILGALILAACSSVPDVIESTTNSSTSDPNNPNGGGLITNPNGSGESCSGPQNQNFNFTPNSSRGANVILALDDSGSMTGEIDHVVSVIDAFIRNLILATQDNLRLMLVFSMNGPNGSAFSNSALNPFKDVIDNQRVFHVSQGTGSRGSDIALFKAFSLTSFQQTLPSVIPSDAGGSLPGFCTGAGKYFRPRGLVPQLNGDADQGLSQTPSACISSPGLSSDTNGTLSGPISQLLPGVSVNYVTVSDDDYNGEGEFTADPYNGADLVLNMLRDITKPLGDNLPIYYHSIVGLSGNDDPNYDDPDLDLARIGAKHAAMSLRTGGLQEDIRSADYNEVFNNLTRQIIYSEQVLTMACEFSSSRTPVVKLNGNVLSSDKYQFSNGSKELRLYPLAFAGVPEGSLTVNVDY